MISLFRLPGLLTILAVVTTSALAQPFPKADLAHFRDVVRPLLKKRCFSCHGAGEGSKGGLRLIHRSFLLVGGESGPAIDVAAPDRSHLLTMLSYKDEQHRMPPSGKLPADEIAIITKWVRGGAAWPDEPVPEVEEEPARFPGRKDGLVGWSYEKIVRPNVPVVRDRAWVSNPIDAFVRSGQEAVGLTPAKSADRVALIRRAFYDLIGLPPTPAEIDAFVNDVRPDAFSRIVDELLSRPQYGEKWGRHWLDLVRYGETNGYERDSDKREIWRYRDWVIKAFNDDLSYDRFITAQIAGDEIDAPTPDSIIATGFYRLMIWDDEPGQGRLQARYDTLDDIVQTTSHSFLGMSIGCARCHEHKKDPIPQVDYYRFMALFAGVTDMSKDRIFTSLATKEQAAARSTAEAGKRADEARLQTALKAMDREFLGALAARGQRSDGASDLVDLSYRFYRDSWKELPEFDALRPESTGKLPNNFIDLLVATRRDNIGLVFEGKLVVPEDGVYAFGVKTKETSRLVVDGRTVIDVGQRKKGGARRGEITLKKGAVTFRLDYWNRQSGFNLDAWWSTATSALAWRHTTTDPGREFAVPTFDDVAWKSGAPGFGSAGTPGARVGTEWHTSDIWLRTTFDWEGNGGDLVFITHHDEDVTVYVNGVLAAKAPGYTSEYFILDATAKGKAAVHPGKNTLAVHCRQTGGGQYVHVVPAVRRDAERAATAGATNLVNLAFGKRALTVDPMGKGERFLRKRMRKQGKDVLGPERFAVFQRLERDLAKVKRRRPPTIPRAMAVQERGPNPPAMHIHVRGNAHVKGEEVEPGVPACIGGPAFELLPPKPGAKSSGRRRALAAWITHPDNPLTARVMVNRIWQFHFGRGLCASANDFGELGRRPTHPELLDWLASEFIAGGFSIKTMHRLIMGSSAYRMSPTADVVAMEKDPANQRLWRFDLRRLSAEEIRDSMLSVAGLLNLKMGGRPFFSIIPPEVLATSSRPDGVWGKSPEAETHRRSIYIKVKRSLLTPILQNFDLADTDKSCAIRFNTTQPTQSLHLLNGEFTQRMAKAMAARLRREAGDDSSARVRRAVRLVTGRPAKDDEVRRHVAFISEVRTEFGLSPDRALEAFCLVMLNLNEFLYLD